MILKVFSNCLLLLCLTSFGGIDAFSSPTLIVSSMQRHNNKISTRNTKLFYNDDGAEKNAVLEKNSTFPLPIGDKEEETFSWTKQWYPVLPETSVPNDEPIKISVLGKDLVIWKGKASEPTEDDEGGESKMQTSFVSVLDDSCPHRRAPLSTGKIVNGNQLACRYHGWQFNGAGTCTEIPMDSKQRYANKFCTASYPAQIKGGLLWIFMDPTIGIPPPLPEEIVEDESNSAGWAMYISPVSYLSQIENSFDPTHTPFVHDGLWSFYSPENAIPIERYELTEAISENGFALEYTPYLKFSLPDHDKLAPIKFIPPCTVMTSHAHYLVPSKAGETIILVPDTGYGVGQGGAIKTFLSKLKSKRLRSAMDDFFHFYFKVGDFLYKFKMQDQNIMQGQDVRKVKDNKWDDLTPTPSDNGVKAFQKWIRRYGGSGPFPLAELSAHDCKDESMWDYHGKYCVQCQATIKRLARTEKAMQKLSTISMASSLVGVGMIFLQQNSRLTTRLFVLAFLGISAASRSVSHFCAKLIARAFVSTKSNAHLRTMEIYSK